MREKLAIANQMRVSRKSVGNNSEDKKLCSKCYRTYVIECIIKGKDNFKISFRSTYIPSFSKRVSNYYRYIINNIYRLFLIYFTLNGDKNLKKHTDVSKPIHLKIANMPNEFVLHTFLEGNGFEITDEHIYSESTVYDVARTKSEKHL